MSHESFPTQKPEAVEKPPVVEAAEQSLSEMNHEMGEFLGELDIADKNSENLSGDEGEKLRDRLKEIRKEAMFSADWWAGNIYAFTELVVGEGINFPAVEQIKEAKEQETFEKVITRAKKELVENGITSECRRVYKPIVDEALVRGVLPVGYGLKDKIKQLIPNLLFGAANLHPNDYPIPREDAWRFYLGLPQKNDTFDVSDYRSTMETSENSSSEYCYRLKGFWKNFFADTPPIAIERFFEWSGNRLWEKKDIPSLVKKIQENGGTLIDRDIYCFVMGGFNFRIGEDEKGKYIAYSDVWDLASFPENEKGFFGKPYHIYDRLYYDPETFEPITKI